MLLLSCIDDELKISNPIDTLLIKKAKIEDIPIICGDEVSFFATYLADCILTEREPQVEEALDFYSKFTKNKAEI